MTSRSPVVSPGLFDSRPYGFAQAAVVPTPFGRAVHVSGQVAWDVDQNIVGPGDIGRQLEKSLDNLAAALASAGATLDQVGALRLYIRQSHMGDGKATSAALQVKFGDNPPCSTWIGVTSRVGNNETVAHQRAEVTPRDRDAARWAALRVRLCARSLVQLAAVARRCG